MKVSGPGAFSIHSVWAWPSIRNAPCPNAAEASTMPLDSQVPRLPIEGSAVGRGPTSVGPPSADWSTFATTSGSPAYETYHSRAGVAFGSVEVGENWLLPPG